MSQAITLLVTPFENLSGDEHSNGIARSMYMEFLLQFSRFRQFRLVTEETMAEEVSPSYRIRGASITVKDSMRLTVQLFRAGDLSVVWIDRYEARLDNLEDIADSVIAEIVSSIQLQIDEDILARVRQGHSGPSAPYELWLCGVQELKRGTLASDERARALFEKSIELDPGFALGYSGMSMSFFNEWSCQLWDRWDVSQKGAYEWAKKALDLDPRNYVASFIIGRIYLYEGKYDIAEDYLNRMLAINANDPEILVHTAVAFVFLDKIDEAKALYEKAVALSPVHATEFKHVASFIALESGDYKACIANAPTEAPWIDFPEIVGAAHYYLGDIPTAMSYWQKFLDNFKARILMNDHDPTSREALQWVINTSPYKGHTKLKKFWDYMAGADPLNYARNIKGNTPAEIENTISVEGTLWVFTFHQNRVHAPEVKGFYDLAKLLVAPEKEFHCTELMGSQIVAKGELVMDEKARRRYRDRIMEPKDEIQLCEINNDFGRTSALHDEYEQLLGHMSSSLGLGGKIRKSNDSVEKARSAITWRIRNAIQRLEKVDPILGKHLSKSIQTGIFCKYSPERATTWIDQTP